MNALEVASWRAAVLVRWTAGIAGTLMFLAFVAFFFGEGPPDLSRLNATERLQVLGIAALFCGLPIAWKWEGAGGLVSLAGFGLLAALSAGNLHRWVLVLPALAGAAHLASWLRFRIGAPADLPPWRMPRFVWMSLLGALGVFILLCANEIFGQPPLMTPELRPDRGLAGRWQGGGGGTGVELVIQPDGSVSGAVGDAAISGGRMVYGRSWFGRMMRINSPYRVMGKLAGERFSAPLEYRDGTLEGSVFRRGRPMPVRLIRRPS